jgi:chromosome segregation ATPase
MATSVPKELPEVIGLFKVIEQREGIRKLQEEAIAAQEEALQAQRQEVEDLRVEKQGLMSVIRRLMGELEDLTSEVPQKAHALELRLTDTRQALAAEAEELRHIQSYQHSLKAQISDAEQELNRLRSELMGGQQMARGRGIFTAAPPSLSGPAIISPAPDYDPLTVDTPREEDAS